MAVTTAESNTTDAVRIKVLQHCSSTGSSQCCKFSVDPQLTSLAVLHNLVARAFKLSREFETSYLARDERLPEAVWLPLLSDFDLELAFTRSAEPHLLVKVEFGRSGSADSASIRSWIPPAPLDHALPPHRLPADTTTTNYTAAAANLLPGIFKEKMEKTIGLMQKALNWSDESGGDGVMECGGNSGGGGGGGHSLYSQPPPPPLDDARFQSFLDKVGVLVKAAEMRKTVYMLGLEPSLRKVAWKHLLDVYPTGLTGRERLNYIKAKAQEYMQLRDTWREHMSSSAKVCSEVSLMSNMVLKDVLRTDRQHPYFKGPDDNPNTIALYNILTTYSLNHPSVGYCQGMSDLASPLLVTQRDEGHAYACFVALMSRINTNFHADGIAMSMKFTHLTEALLYYDAPFYTYLQEHQADDLLFCYRWLLLELKREFAFDDAQMMLEVLWSSLPARPPRTALPLFEVLFDPKASLAAEALSATSPKKSPLVSSNKTSAAATTSTNISRADVAKNSGISSARLSCRLKSIQRVSNYGTVCALRRQRSAEAAVLSRHTRRKMRELLRAHSSPAHASHSSGASKMSTKEWRKIEPDGTLGQDKNEEDKQSKADYQVSSNSFKTDCDSSSVKAEIGINSDVNLTPTRKIMNLKEFRILGRSSRDVSSSAPGSPLKTATKMASVGPQSGSTADNSDYVNTPSIESHLPTTVATEVDISLSTRSSNCVKTEDKLKTCNLDLAVENKEFPPSGLSPTISPCEKEPSSNVNDIRSALIGCRNYIDNTPNEKSSARCAARPLSQDLVSTSSKTTTTESSDNSCCNENARRCFSESDAVGDLIEDAANDSDTLCVEVWENPVASSPTHIPVLQSSFDSNRVIDGPADSVQQTITAMPILCSTKAYSTNAYSNNEHNNGSTQSDRDNKSSYKGNNVNVKNYSGTGWMVSLGGSTGSVTRLPPPEEFGGQNPFLMIVCVTILLQHRNFIISQRLDHNDLAMHFDKMVRKHNVHTVLRLARARYQQYCNLFKRSSDSSHETC